MTKFVSLKVVDSNKKTNKVEIINVDISKKINMNLLFNVDKA